MNFHGRAVADRDMAAATELCASVCQPRMSISSDDSEFSVFIEGDLLYGAMLTAIEKGQSRISMESYIFAADDVGWAFAIACRRAAERGVRVRLLIDAAGSHSTMSQCLEQYLYTGGVELRWYRRWQWTRPWRYNRRNHRKLLVVDDKDAFLGGFNIHKECSLAHYGAGRWRDTHIHLKGDLARECHHQLELFWNGQRQRHGFIESDGNVLVTSVNRHCRRVLHCMLQTLFERPDRKTQFALMAAARRGVDVRLLVPGKSDVWLAAWAAQAAYAELLAAGVRVYEYEPRMLHAKTIVFDGERSVLGTANLDYRSFFLNHEINLVSGSRSLAQRLRRDFDRDLLESTEVMQARWTQRRRHRHLLEGIGWMLRRWL